MGRMWDYLSVRGDHENYGQLLTWIGICDRCHNGDFYNGISLETHLLSLPAGHEEAVYCTHNGHSLRITWEPGHTDVGYQHCRNYFVDMKIPGGQWSKVVWSSNSKRRIFGIRRLLDPKWWYRYEGDTLHDVIP